MGTGSVAESTRFAINSALLALPELSEGSARSLESISLHDRHRVLVSGGASASSLYKQAMIKERELQQEELKAVFAEATDGLMEALAPHLEEVGVSVHDTLPDGRHIVQSWQRRRLRLEFLEALITQPKDVSKQAAALEYATFGFPSSLTLRRGRRTRQRSSSSIRTDSRSSLACRHSRLSKRWTSNPSGVEVHVKVKVFDAESGRGLLEKIDQSQAEWEGVKGRRSSSRQR